MGARHRCKAMTKRGTRCTRKPLNGTGYCRVHGQSGRTGADKSTGGLTPSAALLSMPVRDLVRYAKPDQMETIISLWHLLNED